MGNNSSYMHIRQRTPSSYHKREKKRNLKAKGKKRKKYKVNKRGKEWSASNPKAMKYETTEVGYEIGRDIS